MARQRPREMAEVIDVRPHRGTSTPKASRTRPVIRQSASKRLGGSLSGSAPERLILRGLLPSSQGRLLRGYAPSPKRERRSATAPAPAGVRVHPAFGRVVGKSTAGSVRSGRSAGGGRPESGGRVVRGFPTKQRGSVPAARLGARRARGAGTPAFGSLSRSTHAEGDQDRARCAARSGEGCWCRRPSRGTRGTLVRVISPRSLRSYSDKACCWPDRERSPLDAQRWFGTSS